MGLLSALPLLASLMAAAQDEEKEKPLGAKVVQMRNASYYTAPNRASAGAPALYGDKVTVVAIEGGFAKVTKPDGSTAWIRPSCLIAMEKFDPHPENEEEKTRLSAQNYKAGRFDSTVEAKYIDEKGPEMKKAYESVDALMKRQFKPRAEVEKDLAAFRKGGKMGELYTVK